MFNLITHNYGLFATLMELPTLLLPRNSGDPKTSVYDRVNSNMVIGKDEK